MNSAKLIGKNLWYYRKSYLALATGIMVSTTVLTGALMVGDSVRGSLKHLIDIRLGKCRWAIQSRDRFFRTSLAGELSSEINVPVIPALQVTGIGINTATGRRTGELNVIGIDRTFRNLWSGRGQIPGEDEVIISQNLAKKLALNPGDPLLIRIRNTGKAPQNAPFVAAGTPTVSLRLTIAAVAEDQAQGRFSLKSDQKPPLNVFVSLRQLAERMSLPGSANLLLVSLDDRNRLTDPILEKAVSAVWQPADAGINIRQLDSAGVIQVTTDRIFIDTLTADSIRKAFPGAEPIFTYLANSITVKGKSTPYSFVAAIPKDFFTVPLVRGEVLINSWLACDLDAKPGDSLVLTYYLIGPLRILKEQQTGFRIAGIIPIENIPFGPAMMPDFPGISNTGNCRDWETGSPVELSRIRDKDEGYWNEFRGTPKAFINLEEGQELWNNPYGRVTAFRLAKGKKTEKEIGNSMLKKVTPGQAGVIVRPVYREGQEAAANSTDFGSLFLSLSFFLIVSALLLSGFLFSFHIRSRFAEIGILSAVGFRKRRILMIVLTEVCVALLAGVVLGTIVGLFYDRLILFLLNTLWQDAIRTTSLELYIRSSTLILGGVLGICISGSALFGILIRFLRRPVMGMIKEPVVTSDKKRERRQRIYSITGFLLLASAGILLLILLTHSPATESGLFLVTGSLILAGALLQVNTFLIRITRKSLVNTPGFNRLAFKNAGLNRIRTLTAILLLALGVFIIIITGANRKTFSGDERKRNSGTGGFLLWAESTIPLLYDLNSATGKKHYALEDEPLVSSLRFFQMQRLDGDDASCLNLNQTEKPFLLGVPAEAFDSLNPFRFVALDPGIDAKHPWKELDRALVPDVIPAFADQTVITWGLRKKIGDTLTYRAESGKDFKIKLAGGLDNSIFQGNLLISADHFRRFFPSFAGSSVILVDGPYEKADSIAGKLETLFLDYGLSVTPASGKLSEFNSVENTYLTVFVMLGTLGVLIGTAGLGIFLLKNLTERKKEFALYLALGFPKKTVFRILFAEHFFILATGILAGSLAALAGILPSLISFANDIPAGFLFLLLVVIFINGFCWIYFPARIFLRQNLIRTLRNE